MAELTYGQTVALWTGSFFDELVRCGVRNVVVSPGSRSTPLAMAAFELSRRAPETLRVWVDVDERGAAFFGLGMAKASGRPVALVCTSGTATANYYPAVIEAETSRVPLVVLTGDRPPRLQGLGAPQTTDQLNLYGCHVRAFRAMPLPAADARHLAFVRQAAREAVLQAGGRHLAGKEGSACQVASRACERLAGPVHLNFPFDEPLKPDFAGADAWAQATGCAGAFQHGRTQTEPALMQTRAALTPCEEERIRRAFRERRVLVLAGEGTCSTREEAEEVARWAQAHAFPVLADPLSGLRAVDAPHIIDAYDAVFGQDGVPLPDMIIRFGRWPVSKRATTALAKANALNLVVDVGETRDYNALTTWFSPLPPLDFVRCLAAGAPAEAPVQQNVFLEEWVQCNNRVRNRVSARVAELDAADNALHEGSVIQTVLKSTPANSCLFAANSMTVRNLDTFMRRSSRPLCVLANRGQNGIDGTLSSAIGAAQQFAVTTFLTGDLTLQHDLNALALQHELLCSQSGPAPALVVVLMNNDGGAIFDMLPQASEDPYFSRLFLTPQNVDFAHAAAAFHVPYERAATAAQLESAYTCALTRPGISLIEVRTPLRRVKERLGEFWR